MAVGVLADAPHHRRDGGPDGDLVLLDQLERRLRGEPTLRHHQLQPGQQPDDEGGVAAGHVEQRRREQRDGLRRPAGDRAAREPPTIPPATAPYIVFWRLAIMLRWVEMAPFGRPVVPDV